MGMHKRAATAARAYLYNVGCGWAATGMFGDPAGARLSSITYNNAGRMLRDRPSAW